MDAWKKQHAAGERELGKVLEKFFRGQNSRVLESLGSNLTPSAVAQAINEADERDAMMKAIADTMLGMMATGAATVAKQAPKPRKQKKSFDFDGYKLSSRMVTAIEGSFADLQKQPYWLDIQKTYSGSITDLLAGGIEEGLSGPKLAKLLRTTLGQMTKVRAAAIARTETTLAYSAGHAASYEALAADGLIAGKEWLAIDDQDTRDTHSEANGQTVGPTEDFTVGGYSVPYPCHWSLPAEERVNCRCTTAGSFEE